jgi:hypothetical protein
MMKFLFVTTFVVTLWLQMVTTLPIDDASLSIKTQWLLLEALKFTQCDLSHVSGPPLNETQHTQLSPPNAGLSLKFIGLGRGTQNYTCANDSASSVPAANGALATLYDASCIATAADSTLLKRFPDSIVHDSGDSLAWNAYAADKVKGSQNESLFLAVHYFRNATTPFFDFRDFGGANQDWMAAVSQENVSAPADSSIRGSVPWLKLGYREGDGIKVGSIL